MIRKYHRILMLCALLSCMMFVFAGCKKQEVTLTAEDVTCSTLAVTGDDKILSAVTSSFEKDYYTEDGLKSYVEEEISEYKEEHTGAEITLDGISVKDGNAAVVFSYGSLEDYKGFNDTDAFVGSIEDAKQLADWPATFVAKKDGSNVAAAELDKKCKVVMVCPKEATQVKVPGEIKYLSGAAQVSENVASVEAETRAFVVYR